MIDLKEAAGKISYKPGWGFSTEKFAGHDILVINALVLHSQTLQPVTFAIRRIIPAIAGVSTPIFLSWTEDILAEAEFHELREFFRHDGKLVDDPHATEEMQ